MQNPIRSSFITSARSVAFAAMCATLCVGAPLADAQVFNEQYDHWPERLKIEGEVLLGGGLSDGKLIVEALRNVKDSKIDVIADADTRIAMVAPLTDLESDGCIYRVANEDLQAQLKSLQDGVRVVVLILTKQPSDAQRASFVKAAPIIRAFLQRGGTLVTDGWATELVSAADILPQTKLAVGFEPKPKQLDAMETMLRKHPQHFAIGIAKKTLVRLAGRNLIVAGEGTVTCMIAATQRDPRTVLTIAKPNRRQPPERWLVDWTQWRRDAMDRALPAFPPAQPPIPYVENGTLVIVGGGGMPRGLMEQIVEMAGGKVNARMVYVPCSEREDASGSRTVDGWKKMGVQHATFIHTKDRAKANSDAAFYEPLNKATGLWFGGGRQWNFADSYYGTTTHKLMKEVLRRGGVVAGSSAGASIQARFLARATPIGNFRILAPGYERGGLGFIGGVAIDQHFSQRRRQKDMTQLIAKYPQLLGIGIDEATAIIVRKSHAHVVGRGRVHFYDADRPVEPSEPDYVALPAGSSYDLAHRDVLLDASQPLPPLETWTRKLPHD